MSEGGSPGAVDSDSKPGMGEGHCWDWEAADGAEKGSLRVVGCLEMVALAGGALGMYSGGTGGSSSGSPGRTGLVSFGL
jgi:hypothetical protein